MRSINTVDEINILKEKNFNDPHIIRQFDIKTKEIFKYLVENYINNFAFGIQYKDTKYTIIKKNDEIYFRNNENFNFEFPNCPPPVSSVYSFKTSDINKIISYLN